MNFSRLILVLALLFLTLESGLQVLVRRLRNATPWLITGEDEFPIIDKDLMAKFFLRSHDPCLGWVPRPGTSGHDRGSNGMVEFHIDDSGARAMTNYRVPSIATFGDSYVFCRQVEDSQTWQTLVGNQLGTGVLNFGVGNYGADQAILRYLHEPLDDSVSTVILGFVPETICRIHSVWKHYLEFGNILAFKPRFIMSDGFLRLLPNPVQTPQDLENLQALLPSIQSFDAFYQAKFRRYQFRNPYSWSLVKQPRRHITLLSLAIARGFARTLRFQNPNYDSLPFQAVMRQNIREAHSLYRRDDAQQLLTELLRTFVCEAQARGHRPIVVVFPQLMDLLDLAGAGNYQQFFLSLSEEIPVLDTTSAFQGQDLNRCFVNDRYGGHYSPYGNYLISQHIASFLISQKELGDGRSESVVDSGESHKNGCNRVQTRCACKRNSKNGE